MNKYVSIDIGGTAIKYGIIYEDAEIICKRSMKTEAWKGGPAILQKVTGIVEEMKQEAQEEMLRSWELAKMDGFLEPFIEHHGLLRGLIEACIRNRDPEAYQRITEGVISFSRGWMALHNPENRRKVTGELSTMEFSIAMLASGGWTNKEIGEHLGISINTVKHYLTDIFCKLNVKKRDELKKFMLK